MRNPVRLPLPAGPADRPRLAPDTEISAPASPGEPWLARSGERYFRLGAPAATLLRQLDGTQTARELTERLGAPWGREQVDAALGSFARLGLLDGGRLPDRPRRVRFVPPLTVQLNVLDPSALLRRAKPWLASTPGGAWAALVVVAAALGAFALAVQWSTVTGVLGGSLPLVGWITVWLGVLATAAIHELAHAAALVRYGGRPRRLGVMLFYLNPALFCDVSDGWRLPRRQQRVVVALAGLGANVVVAGVAAMAALALEAGPARDGLIALSLAVLALTVLNLVPFVKFDGYLALMSYLDVSHLRAKALADARHALGRALFGGRHARELPQFRWAVPFGFACMLFPVYLIASVTALWLPQLAQTGVVGGAVTIGLLFALAWRGVLAGLRVALEARAAGARASRIAFVSALLVCLAGGAAAAIAVPRQVHAGHVLDRSGALRVPPPGADHTTLRPGVRVRLERRGVLSRPRLGDATRLPFWKSSDSTDLGPPPLTRQESQRKDQIR